MYSQTSLTTGSAALAATGIAAGQLFLIGVALVVAGITLWQLIRKPGAHKP